MSDYWLGRRVLVTGGASFIGSHVVDALIQLGASVRVVDNLSSGRLHNIAGHIETGRLEFIEGNLLDREVTENAVRGMKTVIHLAADHGGRGYVDLHQVACSTNMVLDGQLFSSCAKLGVEKVVFASSGCVYPNYLQSETDKVLYLDEDKVGPPCDADNMYGWAKLMGEMTLRSYYREGCLKAVSCRYFTVYGERGKEDHAVMAMIARAFTKEDPFIVWGDGSQIRNWTYVSDIVNGTLLAAEKIEDGTAVNLGTMERIRVMDAVEEIMRYTNHHAAIELHPEMPTGPLNRVADNSLAKHLLDWEPAIPFIEGLHRTMEWYYSTKTKEDAQVALASKLTER